MLPSARGMITYYRFYIPCASDTMNTYWHTLIRNAIVNNLKDPLIAVFMGPTWGPSVADRTQVGPMLAPWTLLSGSLDRVYAAVWLEDQRKFYYSVKFGLFHLNNQRRLVISGLVQNVILNNWGTKSFSKYEVVIVNSNTSWKFICRDIFKKWYNGIMFYYWSAEWILIISSWPPSTMSPWWHGTS